MRSGQHNPSTRCKKTADAGLKYERRCLSTHCSARISEIQKKANRRKRLIEQQISTIRGQIAKDLISAEKEGDLNSCKTPMGALPDLALVNSYCNDNIITDVSCNQFITRLTIIIRS